MSTINKIALDNKTVAINHFLSELSKTKRGYPLKTFNARLAYVFWCLLIRQLRPDEPMWKALFEVMRETMGQRPLDMRRHRSLRLGNIFDYKTSCIEDILP